MRKESVNTANKLVVVFIIVNLFIETFMCNPSDEPMLGYASGIWMIAFANKNYLIYSVCVLLSLFFTFVRKKIRWDALSTFLSLRFFFLPAQLLMSTVQDLEIRVGNYIFWMVELVLYILLKNHINQAHKDVIKTIFKVFSILISYMVIVQSVYLDSSGITYGHISYKACLVCPIGGSNSLAAIILPVVLAWIYEKKRKTCFSVIGISINATAIILTKSRTAILIMVLFVIYYFILLLKKRETVLVGLSVFLIGGMVSVAFLQKNVENVEALFSGFTSIYEGASKIDSLSSGRVSEIIKLLKMMPYSPLFGYGPNFTFSRSHNLFVDIFFSTGIIGIILFVKALYGIKRTFNIKKSWNDDLFFAVIIMVMFLMSMVEISIFNVFLFDLIFFVSVCCLSDDGTHFQSDCKVDRCVEK